jgi:hypothetical protein
MNAKLRSERELFPCICDLSMIAEGNVLEVSLARDCFLAASRAGKSKINVTDFLIWYPNSSNLLNARNAL